MGRYSAYEMNGLWYIYDSVFHYIIPFSPEYKTERACDSRVYEMNRQDDKAKIKSQEMNDQQLLTWMAFLLSQGRSVQVDIRPLPKDSSKNKVSLEREQCDKNYLDHQPKDEIEIRSGKNKVHIK